MSSLRTLFSSPAYSALNAHTLECTAKLPPLLAYRLADGRDEAVEWSLALAGSGLQVASVTHATWRCLDAR